MILKEGGIVLRRAGHDDVASLTRIRNEPEVARWWGNLGPAEIEREVVGSEKVFLIEVDGDVAGAIEFDEENEPMYRHATVDIYLTASRHRQGIGTGAIRILARYLFEERGHHRLTIDPAADNAVAIQAYERVGFRKVGIMRQYERGPDGTWRDGLLMDMLREDFVPRRQAP